LKNKQNINAKNKETILAITRAQKPQTTQQLIEFAQQETGLTEKEIAGLILQLEEENKLKFTHNPTPQPTNLKQYIKTKTVVWYWITLTLAAATTIAVFAVPGESYPAIYIRQVLGIIFVLFLPGYAFIKMLFPSKMPIIFQNSTENMDTIERVALSLGMSLALVPMVGLILNYTPWGIRLTPIVLSLLALTVIFATAALIREYQAEAPNNPGGEKDI
jgi:hypothetical protein